MSAPMTFYEKIKRFIKYQPITSTILLINFVMTVILFLDGNFSINTLVKYGGLNPLLITQFHEYYRLVTVMFLHGSIIHFLVNSLAIYFLAGQMELILGPRKYALLYFVSGIGSSLLVVLLGAEDKITVGASGAIFGIMGGMLLLTFIRSQWFNKQSINSIRQMTIINLVITFLVPNISAAGHIGGLITGILLFYFLTPEIPYFIEKQRKSKIEPQEQKDQFN